MSSSRLGSLIRKEFLQIVRDPRTLVLTFIFPIVMLFLLGYAATNDVKNISLAVYDQDNTAYSRALLDSFRAADYFRIDYMAGSEDQIRALIDSNLARAALIIPPGYGETIAGGGNANAMAPLMPASRFDSSALIAPYCSSGFLRLDHSSKVMKKNAL